MRFGRLVIASIAAGIVGGAPTQLQAGPITGTVQASGGITLSSTAIRFEPAASSGLFAGLGGTDVAVKPLAFGGGAIADFAVFAANPNLRINVTGAAPAAFSSAQCFAAPAVGQTCTPPGTSLNFANTANGSSMTLSLQANVTDIATGTVRPGAITYTTQFAGQSYQDVLASLGSGGSLPASYSAEFKSAFGSFGMHGLSTLSSTGLTFPAAPSVGSSSVGWTSPLFDAVIQSASGSFAGLAATLATEQDLIFGTGPLANFLTFVADPTRSADFLGFGAPAFGSAACAAAPAVGQTCSAPTLPFMFENVYGSSGLSAVVSFDLNLLMRDLTDSALYRAIYTTQFTDTSYQQLLADIFAGQSLHGIYSLTLAPVVPTDTTPVPEPASLLLVGTGLAAVVRRKRRSR